MSDIRITALRVVQEKWCAGQNEVVWELRTGAPLEYRDQIAMEQKALELFRADPAAMAARHAPLAGLDYAVQAEVNGRWSETNIYCARSDAQYDL